MINANAREQAPSRDNSRGAARPWELGAAVLIAALVAFNELLPVIFGTGKHAIWDWAFAYVTLRAIVIPVISLAVLVSSIIRLPFSRGRMVWIRVGSAAVAGAAVYASWI